MSEEMFPTFLLSMNDEFEDTRYVPPLQELACFAFSNYYVPLIMKYKDRPESGQMVKTLMDRFPIAFLLLQLKMKRIAEMLVERFPSLDYSARAEDRQCLAKLAIRVIKRAETPFPDHVVHEIVHFFLDCNAKEFEFKINEANTAELGYDSADRVIHEYWKPLIKYLPSGQFGRQLVPNASKIIQNGEWSHRLSAIASLALFGEKCPEDMAPLLMQIATSSLADSHPLVRNYASLLALTMFERFDQEELQFENVISSLAPAVDVERDGGDQWPMLQDLCKIIRLCPENQRKAIINRLYDDLMPKLKAILGMSSNEQQMHGYAIKSILYIGEAVHKERFAADFLETVNVFKRYVSLNDKHAMTGIQSLEKCFSCDEVTPEVIIKKSCGSVNCGNCICRPYWCADCIARIYFVALTHSSSNITASCPFCRLKFCLDDITMIVETADDINDEAAE